VASSNSQGLSDRLKQFRAEQHITQAELGRLLDLSQETITNYESGGRFPRPQTLRAIARLLGLSLDDLVGYPPSPKRDSPRDGMKSGYPTLPPFNLDGLIDSLRQDGVDEAFRYTRAWRSSEGIALVEFFEQALLPVLAKIGSLWRDGTLSVADEHLFSEKIRELAFLHANREPPAGTALPGRDRRWIGFCAPGEKHELALLFHSLALRQAGWRTKYLGTQVPLADLTQAIEVFRPQVLGVSVTMEENVEGMESFLRQLRSRFGSSPAIIVGGQGLLRSGSSIKEVVDAVSLSIRDGCAVADSYSSKN
jgi:MerR family transcriptional regulator, light-induced transcriptional regulator